MIGRFIISALFVSLTINKNEAARILAVFPMPSISHQVVFRPFTQELAARGHELTILTTDPAFPPGKEPKNIKEIDLHDDSYKVWREEFVERLVGQTDEMHMVHEGSKIVQRIFEKQLSTEKFQNVLKNQTFDLLIVEACIRSALILTKILKNIPVIQFSSFSAVEPNNDVFGVSSHPLLYPDTMSKKIYNLTLLEKIESIYKQQKIAKYLRNEEYINEIIRRYFGDDAPTINELENNVDMLFLNFNSIWGGNRPIPPSVINLGALHVKPPKELPKDLKQYLDSSSNGVIYMSFGTNVNPSLLPQEKIQIFLDVFSKMPYDVLLKWDKQDLPGKPKNVKIFNWLPQSDLLRHPKIKVFITQGGLQSTDEAIIAGVPLIAFPMLGDQWYNGEKYVYHGIGLKLDINTVTEDSLNTSLHSVILDSSYRDNIVRLGRRMRDEPQTSLERAVWWTEYVIRHKGAKHLRSPAANIHWTQYYMVDVLLLVGVAAVIMIALLFMLLNLIYRFISHVCSVNVKVKSS